MGEVHRDSIEQMLISEVDFVRARVSIEKRLMTNDNIDPENESLAKEWIAKHKLILDEFFTPNRANNYINKSPSAVIDELITSEKWKER